MTNLGLNQVSKVGVTSENQLVYFTTLRKLWKKIIWFSKYLQKKTFEMIQFIFMITKSLVNWEYKDTSLIL